MDNFKKAGSSLDALISSFSTRIVELQDLAIARNMYPATSIPDLSAIDTTLKTMESQIQAIKARLQEERSAIPKAQKLIEQSERQQRRLQHMLAHLPVGILESVCHSEKNNSSLVLDALDSDLSIERSTNKEEPATILKKGRGPAPRWYITKEELDSLSSYMKGRLTLEKVNIAINELATYADVNAHLIQCPKKKLAEGTWEKALELRDIAMAEAVKGKHFILESEIKGPAIKLDNTGKAILTVLRHLGRIQEIRIGHHRVMILLRSH